jgi:hypothetical protein
MRAPDEATAFKVREVAADAGRRGTHFGENFFDGCTTGSQQQLHNLFATPVY